MLYAELQFPAQFEVRDLLKNKTLKVNITLYVIKLRYCCKF